MSRIPANAVVSYPGAEAPARRRDVDAHGVRIAVWEWGPADGPPLLLAHGGFDFARTFDVFAPLLARGGYRVVSWDQRGHGDSEHAALYSWAADCRDALAVLDATAVEPVALVGHSKGSGLLLDLCLRFPRRFRRFVNLDGLPSTRRRDGGQQLLAKAVVVTTPQPDKKTKRAHTTASASPFSWARATTPREDDSTAQVLSGVVALGERVELRHRAIGEWLDQRRRAAGAERRVGTLDGLAQRRGRMNPRLSHDWLRYLVSVGARRDADGWRWKIDPTLRFGGLGPWRPQAALAALRRLEVPMLAVVAGVDEPMSWGTDPSEIGPLLPDGCELVHVAEHGHFLHIEAPARMAELALRFLAGEGS